MKKKMTGRRKKMRSAPTTHRKMLTFATSNKQEAGTPPRCVRGNMDNPEYKEKMEKFASEVSGSEQKEFTVSYYDGRMEKMRLFVNSYGEVCYYAKGRRRYGYRLDIASVVSIAPKAKSDPYSVFLKNVRKAEKLLSASGMWPDIRKRMEGLSTLTEKEYEKMKEWYLNDETDNFCALMKGKGYPDPDFYHFGQLSRNGQIVSVPYSNGGYCAETQKSRAEHMLDEVKSSQEVKHLHFAWFGGYDYSVEFAKCEDGVVRGWYSAEYKGCGNGHYYLLLDATHAWYYEDD